MLWCQASFARTPARIAPSVPASSRRRPSAFLWAALDYRPRSPPPWRFWRHRTRATSPDKACMSMVDWSSERLAAQPAVQGETPVFEFSGRHRDRQHFVHQAAVEKYDAVVHGLDLTVLAGVVENRGVWIRLVDAQRATLEAALLPRLKVVNVTDFPRGGFRRS